MSAGRRFAIVLAGGQGSRLAELTRVDGENVPKQYWALAGGPSMLQQAITRAAAFAAPERVLVVVAAEHRKFWQQLAGLPPENVVVQPADRGTAAGLMLPLAEVLRRDPQAIVAVVPADHHVEREAQLAAVLHRAAEGLAEDDRRVALIGIRPREADPELGWIVTAGAGEWRPVGRFREKPPAAEAAALLAQGALVNTFLMVARGAALWRLCERRLPEVALPLARRQGGLEQIYAALPVRDFSREVLEKSAADLVAIDAGDCGWSDLGTPARVAACLNRLAPARRRRGASPYDLRRQLAGKRRAAQRA